MSDPIKSPLSVSGKEEERPATIGEVLKAHWLTSVDCDHAARTDTARCFCTLWTGTPQPSVGGAVNQWIAHVVEMLAISRTVTAKPIFIGAPYARALADRDATGGLSKVAEKELPDVR